MAEKIKTDAFLCALPDEWLYGIRTVLRNKGIETIDAHNREEMLALLERQTFRGMVTVSSWLPEDEVMARDEFSVVPSIQDTDTVILLEPQHAKFIPERFRELGPVIRHDWVYMPFDLEEVILRVTNIWRWPPKT